MKRFSAVTTVAVLVLAGALAGCRGGDTDTGGGASASAPGVTKEACPNAIDKSKGCIYLGIISDLTEGPFKALAVPITEAQKAFWARVNKAGGIGGYEIDVTTYIRDNKYKAEVHNQVYQEIKGKVLALAQTLGSPTTAAIIDDLRANKIVSAPASWTSAWAFQDVILESGANYCIESMNAIDYAMEKYQPKSVLAVHYPGDYGADAAAGAKLAAAKLGLAFSNVQTSTGATNQAAAVQAVVTGKPDLVILTTGPAEAAAIVGTAAQRGFTGRFIGTSPTWNPGLIGGPAARAITALYEQSSPWNTWSTDSPGHKAMREAIGTPPGGPNDGYTSGWVWSYPLKAALEKAAADNKLTRDGLLEAAKSLSSVDYEGMLPTGAGNYAAGPDGQVRHTAIYKPDPAGATKVSQVKDLFIGPTAQSFKLERPCFDQL
ncbi:MAG TPA: ABC transporter substrate-binding protein [Micromonosporaceae bacterium]|nr:ABC transporter substrate-binding protein [Micromonosporaceae bacterium]